MTSNVVTLSQGKSVNMHRNNNRIHALLQKSNDIHILLIQEP
jgi:hypothetical protein